MNSRTVPSTWLRHPDPVTPGSVFPPVGGSPLALTDTWILACSKRHSLPVKAGDTASLARGREAPLLGLLRRPLLACPGPPTPRAVRSGSCSTALKRLMSICLPMLMCLGDVSGSREEGSRLSSGACRRQGLRVAGGDPLPGCAAHAPGQGGRALEAAAACVGGRAPARWTWKPHCWPLAPMPATPQMARTTSPRPVSRV